MSPSIIMGLTTQDPYIQKEYTKLYRILKFRVNWANIEQDTAIQKLQNLLTNVWIAGHLSGNSYISLQKLNIQPRNNNSRNVFVSACKIYIILFHSGAPAPIAKRSSIIIETEPRVCIEIGTHACYFCSFVLCIW